ncbi:cytochrome P450 [Daedalea quercina L-15889]|uniref:Cytochrome P450 n=1 Tax=Daedalea quercina L-15889 TaxID=1314783 RepID=A0A165MFE4_9APHY|nr:cytochrome P450 [Daedalea quercina L-15889]
MLPIPSPYNWGSSAPVYLLSACTVLAVFALWKLGRIVLNLSHSSSLRILPAPPSPSWLYGNLREIAGAEARTLHEKWVEQYGSTITYKGLFNEDILYTIDTRAVNHILSHSVDYWKPSKVRYATAQLVGTGLVYVEGDQHRQQRRVKNPGFGPSQIRDLTGIFVQKSIELANFWKDLISKTGEPARIEVLDGLSRMTLDVIGLAGFNYHFDALSVNGKRNELNAAFSVIFGKASNAPSIFGFLRFLFPPLRYIPLPQARRVAKARKIMHRVGMQLIREKKAEATGVNIHGDKMDSKHADLQSRDLLTLLTRANMDPEIPENQRLSDEEILAQVPTFLVAGHETTSNATGWALYALAIAPEIQGKLREEVWGLSTDNPTMDELQELEYLDFVVRETLRLHAPVPSTIREAVKDDLIPLNVPFTDVNGQVHDAIKIDKGTAIDIPIIHLNRSKAIWGEDALEFKPERWATTPEAAHNVPGVWGNMMTFLGGPRSCIGYRFTLVEMKALLFTLIRTFEFELALPKEKIVRQRAAIQRPIVRGEMEKGSQLPMLIKVHKHI